MATITHRQGQAPLNTTRPALQGHTFGLAGKVLVRCAGWTTKTPKMGAYGVHAYQGDKQARSVYRRHFPGATIHHDIKELRGHALAPVDALFFGSPCQDLSDAGLRAGLGGARRGE